MKQSFICQNEAYATSAKFTDLTTVPEGAIALFSLKDGTAITSKPTSNFSFAVGRGTNKMPLVFPEVDVKSLTVEKASYEAGGTFTAKITVPTPEVGKEYTVLVTKKGTVFNERNTWSFSAVATSDVAANVAKQIVAQINGNKYQLGVTAENTGGTITITAAEIGTDYEVLGGDGLMGVELTDVTHGKKAVCDKAYIKDLASRCAAGKGFNYTDDADIYPGYPEVVADNEYVLYTLRFAVPRISAKQRDEVVYQLVHIAVPTESSAVATLDAIFGTSSEAEASVVSEDKE